jgi:uncharacterized protein YuzE
MKIRYDKEADVLYIKLSSLDVFESDQEKPGVIIDYAENGEIVGIEVLMASKRVDQVNGVLYELA